MNEEKCKRLVAKYGPILDKIKEQVEPFKASELFRNMTPEECEKVCQEFLKELPAGSQVSVSTMGFANITLPLYVTSRNRGGRGEPTEDDVI